MKILKLNHEKKSIKKKNLKTNSIEDPIDLEIDEYTRQISELDSEAKNILKQSNEKSISKEDKKFYLNKFLVIKEKIRGLRESREKLLKKQRLANKNENLKNDQKIEKAIKEEYLKGNEIFEDIIKDDAEDQQNRDKFEINKEKAKKVAKVREGFLNKAIGDNENKEEVDSQVIKVREKITDGINLSCGKINLTPSENNNFE